MCGHSPAKDPGGFDGRMIPKKRRKKTVYSPCGHAHGLTYARTWTHTAKGVKLNLQ